ncbi:hypothetical protein C9374_000074 [Naegleria lovaniensis]|uniref:Uncharacterized protein n=1 Tax=Naegleria lovaniensis TaxID=51637 RepID=A0AA88GX48_NAELO|nr:uncharacterized protein C9374_000074 [Naegleria lovaniensis]KAG2388635.1 hypothetical protein C9374_000074 [Naegleria lovaniensis]
MTTTSTTTTTTTAGATSSDHILNTTTTSSNSNHSTTSAARFSRIHHHYNGNMVTSSQRKTMFFPTPPHHHSSMSSILDYNNPWKDLFIERYRIIHGSNASSKRKLGIFSSRRETSSEDYVEKGYRYVYRNEYSKAIHYFEKAISLSKEGSCARAWEGLAKICWIRDLPQYVIVYAEEALKNNPVNPGELFFIRGKALLKLNRIVEALPDLTKAVNFLTMSPVNYHLFLKISEVYYERMMCHIELGNIDQALADGETIMTTDKCFETDCFFKAAKILYEKQHYDDAEKFMSSSYVKKTPEYYLLNLQIKSANGCYPQALENLKKFEELEAKKRSNTFNNSATVLTKESLIDIGIVLLMNDCINEAVEYFTKGALLRSTAASQTNNTASPPSSSSDDLIFNSLMRRSSLSFAFSSHKVIDEEATRRAKLFVIDAAQRQKTEYSSYFGVDLNGSSYFDIHMAWSYYYYLLAMLYYCRNTITFNGVEKGRYSATFSTRSTATQLMSLTSHNQNDEMGSSARLILLIKGQKNYIYQQRKLSIRFVNENLENDLKHSITNLTRAITLNPTLCEGFYYRSLMKCFLQIDNHLVAICSSPMFGSTLTQNGIVSFLIEKFKKKKSPQKDAITDYKRHKKMHKNISDKINVVTNMRESLNDCENAFTLITMELRINTVDELEEIDFKSNSDISTIDLSTKSRKHTELLVDILLLRAFLFYSFGKKAECTECTNLACYLCHSASASSTPSENAENCPSNATPSTTSTNLASPSQIEENSQQETEHILLESITFERQLLACQGLFALNEDFEALKESHPRFLTMRNDAIQRHVDQLIMNFIIEPEYSYVSQQLDYMLVIIHSQLLQKDLQTIRALIIHETFTTDHH